MEDVPVDERNDILDASKPYTLTKLEKPKFLWRLWMQKFPDGYCSNIGNCIKMKDFKILGLKSHDHHVLMQQLLSVAVKGLLPAGREAKLCGPVHYRWMYPFERYMKVLKGYVKNRAAPEGSIAENYLVDECVWFCGRYMKHSSVFSRKRKRNDVVEDDTIIEGSTLLKGRSVQLTDEMHKAVHLCVLNNSQEVVPYIK
ncbi:hypothetical protein ACLB2K_072527 [Fragaria x ananassa]